MNIIDIFIIILLLFGFMIGWKNGFIKQSVFTIGLVCVVVISFILKNPLSSLLYKFLPFFKFSGALKDVSVINIIIYEFISFIILLVLLTVIFKIIARVSSIIEKILKATIILGIPSKILGGIVGIVESFVIIYIILFFLSLPVFEFNLINDSKFSKGILNNMPILSNVCEDTLNIYSEIKTMKDEYSREVDKTELNDKILHLLLENKFVSYDNVNELIKRGKLKNVTLGD